MQIKVFIPVKVSYFWKVIQQSSLITEMMIQKNLKGLRKKGFNYIAWRRLFLAINIIAIYILLEMQW